MTDNFIATKRTMLSCAHCIEMSVLWTHNWVPISWVTVWGMGCLLWVFWWESIELKWDEVVIVTTFVLAGSDAACPWVQVLCRLLLVCLLRWRRHGSDGGGPCRKCDRHHQTRVSTLQWRYNGAMAYQITDSGTFCCSRVLALCEGTGDLGD